MPRIPRLRRGEGDRQRPQPATASEPLAPTPPDGTGDNGASAPPPASTSAVVAAPAGGEHATTELAAGGEPSAADLAGGDAQPRFLERARLRRRLRELRRLREVAFRDLGGLTFDLHRFGRDRSDLVAEKLQALGAIDAELRSIEALLGERRETTELREPGIAACPRCATLHGADANFCPGCGTPLRGSVVREAGPLRVTPYAEEQAPAEGQAPAEQQAAAGQQPSSEQEPTAPASS